MQRLQRIDQHAGDVASLAEHTQSIVRHIVQGVGLARGHRISDARLNVAPPAVIGAAEANEVRAARVIARQPHRLHHRFGAGHVERHLVLSRNLPQAFDVVHDRRMVGAEHRSEITDALKSALDALLVKIVAEEIDPVGAGQVVVAITVKIADGHAGRRLHERPGAQMLTHKTAELEWHPIGVGELQVRNARP